MSRESLKQFMNQVADDDMLQARIGGAIEAESLIALGAECGCEFTTEDLQDSAELLSNKKVDVVTDPGCGCWCKDPTHCATDRMWCRQVVG
ncbi:MAG: Nif11-like leader peptide family natural product precursor [Arenicellales bacterium]|nr:Nif11-like leader peptide family natural product precursor [Arenicellales bacterium]